MLLDIGKQGLDGFARGRLMRAQHDAQAAFAEADVAVAQASQLQADLAARDLRIAELEDAWPSRPRTPWD